MLRSWEPPKLFSRVRKGEKMDTATYTAKVEEVIAEHQRTQMANPPSSKKWQDASKEINRLAKLIVSAGNRQP
jgi:hypothetical protein